MSHIYIYIYLYIYICVYIYVRMFVCMWLCMYVHVYISTHMSVDMYTFIGVRYYMNTMRGSPDNAFIRGNLRFPVISYW